MLEKRRYIQDGTPPLELCGSLLESIGRSASRNFSSSRSRIRCQSYRLYIRRDYYFLSIFAVATVVSRGQVMNAELAFYQSKSRTLGYCVIFDSSAKSRLVLGHTNRRLV
ncbi:hypothetical protein M407DRAFT_243531 [Tulasnella calospora MUT 4182]|uniref:Uncharacterized protein n=1 Tax=Tulasnella calospora MUT 4182 TaxID=1051891 RepID=A0A0C3KZS8_9AGAM|nr:hypothetical protein M407DRAFT_243531 [Tulasnella calospora MUT 4182]